MVCHIVRGKGSTIRPLEDVVIGLIGTAKLAAVFFFLRLGGKKDTAGFGGHRKAAAAAFGFGLILFNLNAQLADGMMNQNKAVREVHAIPFKPRTSLRRRPYRAVILTSGNMGSSFITAKSL